MTNIIIYIATFLVLLIGKAIWDKTQKNKGRIINHGKSVIFDGFIYLLAGYFLICSKDGCTVPFFIGIIWTSGATRWILYDLIYNVINNEKWNHYGDSAWLDRQMNKLGNWSIVVKLITLGIGINLIVWF